MFKQLKDSIIATVDGTYTRLGNVCKFDRGYQVSFEREDDDYSDNLFDTTVITLIAKLQSDVFVGVWGGVREISFHTNSKDLALMVATIYHQDAIWDWANNKAITLK